MKCPYCGKFGDIVNECGCDPNNLPTTPTPNGLHADRNELWRVCDHIVHSAQTGDDLKQMALGIRQQLRLEAKVTELTDLFYAVREHRDKLRHMVDRVECYCPVPIQDEIREVRRFLADAQSYEDLAASGGVVDTPQRAALFPANTKKEFCMLVMSRRKNERIIVTVGSEVITITVVDSRDGGKKVVLGFEAPRHIQIDREEIHDKKQREQEQG